MGVPTSRGEVAETLAKMLRANWLETACALLGSHDVEPWGALVAVGYLSGERYYWFIHPRTKVVSMLSPGVMSYILVGPTQDQAVRHMTF